MNPHHWQGAPCRWMSDLYKACAALTPLSPLPALPVCRGLCWKTGQGCRPGARLRSTAHLPLYWPPRPVGFCCLCLSPLGLQRSSGEASPVEASSLRTRVCCPGFRGVLFLWHFRVWDVPVASAESSNPKSDELNLLPHRIPQPPFICFLFSY